MKRKILSILLIVSLSLCLIALLFVVIFALSGCGQSVSKPEDFTIGDGVLTGYTGKASKVEIPEGVTAIGERAFEGNRRIKSVTIPDSCLRVGYEAFYDCQNLTELVLPDNGIWLATRSFMSCYKLKTVTLPESAMLGINPFGQGRNDHEVNPCPEGIKISGVINYLNHTGLCNMRETEDGELCLTFAQTAGKLIPVTFGADGTAQVELKPGFRVALRMADGSEISADRSQVQFDQERSMYYYLFWFPTTQRPETIICFSAKETTELDGTTWRTR